MEKVGTIKIEINEALENLQKVDGKIKETYDIAKKGSEEYAKAITNEQRAQEEKNAKIRGLINQEIQQLKELEGAMKTANTPDKKAELETWMAFKKKRIEELTASIVSSGKKEIRTQEEKNARIKELLKQEMNALAELRMRAKQARDPKDIELYTKRISETGARIKRLGGDFRELKDVANMNLREMQVELTRLRKLKFDNLSPQEIKQIKSEMNDLTRGIREFREQTMAASESGIPGIIFGLQGIIASAQLVTGTLSLFGVENEKLNKTMMQLIGVSQALLTVEDMFAKKKLQVMAAQIKDTYQKIALTLATKAQAMATEEATIATQLLGKALMKIPLIAIIAGVVALATGVGLLAKRYYDNLKATKENSDAYIKQQAIIKVNNDLNTKASDVASDRINSIKVLAERIRAITGDEKKRNKLIDEYNKIAESAGGKTLKYATSVKELNTATEENIQLLFRQAKAEAAVELSKERTKELIDNEMQLIKLKKQAIPQMQEIARLQGLLNEQIEVTDEKTGEITKKNKISNEYQRRSLEDRIALQGLGNKEIYNEAMALNLKNKNLKAEWSELMKIVTANEDLFIIEEELGDLSEKKSKKELDDTEKLRQAKIQLAKDYAKELAQLQAGNIKDQNQRELALLKVKHEQERQAIIEKYGKETELLKQLKTKQLDELAQLEKNQRDTFNQSALEGISQEEKNREEVYSNIMTDETLNLQERKGLLDEFYQAGHISRENYDKGLEEIDIKQQERNQALYDSLTGMALSAGGAISSVFDAIASSSEEGSERQKRAQKNSAIADLAITQAVAIADIASAIIKAQKLVPPLNIIESIRIGALGVSQIASIVKSANDIKKMEKGGRGEFSGKRHSQGGIRFGNVEVEDKEKFWVLSRQHSKKYGHIMDRVFDDIQRGKISAKGNIFAPNIELNDENTEKIYNHLSGQQEVERGNGYRIIKSKNKIRKIYE